MGNLSDLELRILRLVRLIINTNEMIDMHKARYPKGMLQVKQYEELKARYEHELYEILTVEMGVRFPSMALAA